MARKKKLPPEAMEVAEMWAQVDRGTQAIIMGDLIERMRDIKKAKELVASLPKETPEVRLDGKIIRVEQWERSGEE